jgi:hypothetical protein
MRSAFAILRLVTNSHLVGSSTGRGGGLDAQVLDQQNPAGARDRLQDARSLAVELGTQQMDNAVERGKAGRDARANMKPMTLVQCTSRADRGRSIMFAVTDTR